MSVLRPASRMAIVALSPLLLVGCGIEETPRPADIAGEVLAQFVDDATMLSGFTISETRITVTSGEPPSTQQLYPETDEPTEPLLEPAHPFWTHGRNLDVTRAAARAKDSLEQCGENWGMVEVEVLSDSTVATDTVCEIDGQEVHSVLLDDEELPSLPGPVTGTTIETVWSEIEAAGLAETLASVEFDTAADVASIQFSGPSPSRTYEWGRGLDAVTSTVLSHPHPVDGSLDLAALPAADVTAALDEALAGLPDPGLVVRVEVNPTSEGGAELVLSDVDHNPLATVALA